MSNPRDEDCPDPICFKTDPLKTYQKSHHSNRQNQSKILGENKKDIFADEDDNNNTKVEEDHYKDCPNTRDSLGFYTWNFLHTMGIYYPKEPTQQIQEHTINFFNSFAQLYPCKVCRAHFQKDIIKYPPPVQNNEELSIWLCERHNDVNKWKGKPIFDCTFSNLEKRWKTGFDHCNESNI